MDKKIAKTILIVEDNQGIRKSLAFKLEEGFKVLEATNGKEGLDMAIAKHPDLILLDLVMPVMDGITMLRELRKDEWGKDAKLILLTSLSDQGKVSEAVELGAFDYLVKTDWSLEAVVKKIEEKLEIQK